jgi:hypothetical protein
MSEYFIKTLTASKEEIEFIEEAAEVFRRDPKIMTFTKDKIVPGCFFAIRWGLHDKSILVFKVADDFNPTIYDSVITEF